MEQTTYKKMIERFGLVYFAMVGTVIIFAAVVIYINRGDVTEVPDSDQLKMLFRYVLIALVPAGIGAGNVVYKLLLSRLPAAAPLREKYLRYQGLTLLRAALCEIPGMLGCVVTFITHDNSFLLFTGVSVVMLLLWRPTNETIKEDLQLSPAECAILDDPNAIFK